MTPTRNDDVSKFKLTIRDALLLITGILSMYAIQLGTQYGMRSDIRNLQTSFEESTKAQHQRMDDLQRQLDEIRRQSQLNAVYIDETKNKLSELKGILMGAGVKGIPK